MAVDVHLLISEAAVVFDGGEQLAADLPSYPVGADLLRERFKFAEIAQGQQGNQTLWVAQKGQCDIGERQFLIDNASGHPRMLSVSVRGKTADAIDVLQELWARLVECEQTLNRVEADGTAAVRPEAAGRIQALGRPIMVTTAVVKLPFRVEQLFPQADFLREQVKNSIDTAFRVSREPTVRFGLDMRLEWGIGNRSVGSTITFEPRAGDKLDSKLFFTRSPLPSEEHLRIVERFVEQFAPAR